MAEQAPIRLHTQSTGSGPAVLLVHGMGDDSSIWSATVTDLSADCACTAVDLLGHGASPAPEEESAYEREALLVAIDAVLAEIGPAVLVGHSLGGYLGLAHAITRPGVLRGLVLVATGPGFRDPAAMADWNRRVLDIAPSLSTPLVASTASLHVDSMVIERFDEVTVPVGLIVGSEDKAFLGANDYMQRRLVNVRRETVQGGRHRLMRRNHAEVAAITREILAAAGLSDSNGPNPR